MTWPAPHPPQGITIGAEAYDGDGARHVVARAESELVARYGVLDAGELGLVPAMFQAPAGVFLVARAPAGAPIGGVGLRTVRGGVGVGAVRGVASGTATGAATGRGEVRRLWVDEAWRGRGIARALMGRLEHEARALGLTALELATGDRQPEAVGLYSAIGWQRQATDRNGAPLPDRHIRFAKVIA